MNFSKHRSLEQECHRLLEAAEKTVSRSFLCPGFIESQSVIASQTACLFHGAECIEKSMRCLCELLLLIIILIIMIIINVIIIKYK